MLNEERFFEQIRNVKTGKYEALMREAIAIVNNNRDTKQGEFGMVFDAFHYGFLKGQRSERKLMKDRLSKQNG